MAKNKRKALDDLLMFFDTQPPWKLGERVTATDARIAPLLALAQNHDLRVHRFMELLVNRPASFGVFDLQMYGEHLTCGKNGEEWNAEEEVVGSDDVCIARNGAGDPYVWNATTGEVRHLLRDAGWECTYTYETIDVFVDEVMYVVCEAQSKERIDGASREYLACLRFAVRIAGEDALDDEVREKLRPA